MRINWFSPLPPARTEIGHYTERILNALHKRAQVVLWTDQTDWQPTLSQYAQIKTYGSAHIPWEEINCADVTFFNMGNNGLFHYGIWQVSQRVPGIIVVHDSRLPDIVMYAYREIAKDRAAYVSQVGKYYGPEGALDAERMWENKIPMYDLAATYPMTAWCLENAQGAVVHTGQALREVRAISELPLLLALLPFPASQVAAERENHRETPLRLVAFGYLNVTRRLEPFLRAWTELPERSCFRLDIFGELWAPDYVRNLIRTLGLEEQVTIHGFVTESELEATLNRAHLAINLRYPTMGEASSSQLRIWNHALPSLVTQVGMYADLPEDTVAFVRPEHEIADIQSQLRALAADPERFKRMGRNGRRLLETLHSPETYAEALLDFARHIRDQRRTRIAIRLADEVGRHLVSLGNSNGWNATHRHVATHIHTMLLDARE